MESLKNVLQRCREKHGKFLLPRRTSITPAFKKGFYHATVYCAHSYPVSIDDLGLTEIACIPTDFDTCQQKIRSFHRDETYRHRSARSWGIFNWYTSFGIYIYTGTPSECNGAYWHDIELTREAVDSAPDAVMDCLEALLSLATNPLLTMTADGGLRFSCRITGYLHPRSERVYNYNERPYLGILGENGYSPWNARHEIVTGNLLSPPTLDKSLIFAAVDAFIARLQKDAPPKPKFTAPNRTTPARIVEPDPEMILAIREGRLSPLAIKRPKPILVHPYLNAANGNTPENENQEDTLSEYRHTIKKGVRVLGISTGINTVNKAEYVEDGITVSTMSELTKFVRCEVKVKQIQEWYHNHESEPLGNFARMLLNALTTQSTQHAASVQRLRTAMQTFLWKEADIAEQMKPDAKNWFQLKRFFACYNRNADAPIHYDEENQTLEFWLPPPKIHPDIKQLRLFAPSVSYPILKKIFPTQSVATTDIAPKPLPRNTKIFQLRSGIYPPPKMYDYSVDRKFYISKLARSFTTHIKAEQKRNLNFFHAVRGVIPHNFVDELSLKDADVLWILGLPQLDLRQLWIRSMRLFGGEESPLDYDYSEATGIYKDARVQTIYEDYAINRVLTEINEFALSKRINKTLIILSALTIPGITNFPETQFFDWQDFLIAGSLNRLPETIAIREDYERQREALTAESTRQEIESIYGCTSRHANRLRQNLRGGQPLHPSLGDQILACLADGEKSTKEILATVDGHPTAIRKKLKDLVDNAQIQRIRHGIYKRS